MQTDVWKGTRGAANEKKIQELARRERIELISSLDDGEGFGWTLIGWLERSRLFWTARNHLGRKVLFR